MCSVDGCEREFEWLRAYARLHYERERTGKQSRIEAIRKQLEELWDRGWLYGRAGAAIQTVVIQTIAYREYPGIDIDRLAYCLARQPYGLERRDSRLPRGMSEPGAAR